MNVISRSLILGEYLAQRLSRTEGERESKILPGGAEAGIKARPRQTLLFIFRQGVERGLTWEVRPGFNVEVVYNLHCLLLLSSDSPIASLFIYLLICHTWRFFFVLFLFFFGASPLTAFSSSCLCS